MENTENCCLFAKTRETSTGIEILHFVNERKALFNDKPVLPACWSLGLVTAGQGMLIGISGEIPLLPGAMFFLPAAKSYRIVNNGGLHYLYIGFTGTRAGALARRLGITSPCVPGQAPDSLLGLWEESILSVTETNMDLLCEGLLLYSFSFLQSKENEKSTAAKLSGGIPNIKKYMEEHATDAYLSLTEVSRHFGYSPKYVSSAFKRMMKISFCDYLTLLRLRRAVALMESGAVYIRDIAAMAGFRDPLYFSKVFRLHYGIPPKQYITGIRNGGTYIGA